MHTNTNTETHAKREKQTAESTKHDYSVATPTEDGEQVNHRWRSDGKRRWGGVCGGR